MYQFIYQKWWKVLTLLLLLYVFVAGFLVPLKPGVLEVSDNNLERGEAFDIEVITYNSTWAESDNITAFIKYDADHLWQIPQASISNRKAVRLTGQLPDYQLDPAFEYTDATLILYEASHGFMILPSAFTLKGKVSAGIAPTWVSSLPEAPEWTWSFPFRPILYETIRNTFFHVAIWMAMFVLLVVSLIYSIKYLIKRNLLDDAIASSFAHVAILWGMIGMFTGSVWGKATWGTYWTNDPKLNMSAVAIMIYLAYSILRTSINDEDRRAQLSSAYNIFAFVAMIPLIFIIPRLTSSLHPGNGGNPALGGEDLDGTLRMIFYPAILAYTLIGVWMSSLLFRMRRLEIKRLLKGLRN